MQCVFCEKLHFSASCEKVKDIEERKKILLRDRRCFLCIKVGHRGKDCRSQRQCRKCGAAHHQSICPKEQVTRNSNNLNQFFPSSATWQNCVTSAEKKTTPTTGSQTAGNVNTGEQSSTEEQVFTVSGTVKSKNEVLLKTASVMARGENATNGIPVRILSDDGSQKTYITNNLKNRLKLKPIKKQTVHLNTFGSDQYQKHTLDVVKLKLKGQFNGYRNEVEIIALCVPGICSPLPASLDINKYPHLQSYELADKYTDTTNLSERPMEILIGCDQYYDIVTGDTVKGLTEKSPVAVSSIFGYLVCGPTNDNLKDEIHINSNLIILGQHDPYAIVQNPDKLENELKRFWEIEETGVKGQFTEKHIEDENQADEHENFVKDIRFEDDRYQVKLPWIETDNMPPLTGNYDLCNRRLNSLMFRLKKDPKLLKQNDDVFMEQLSTGIIERVPESEYDNNEAYFSPHQPVVKTDRDTTKCRVVFDASSKERDNRFCLNDYLEEGPNIIPNIFDILINFRSKPVGVTADIESAFL